MKEKTILITGANSGVGLQTARNLAKTGARLILTTRTDEKGRATVDDVKNHSENNNISYRLMDLASLDSVRQTATQLLKDCDRIDVLMNNAGLFVLNRQLTKDGHEMHIGVNHLGHFLFSQLLIDRMVETAQKYDPTRLIFVSSALHRRSPGLNMEDLMWKNRKFDGMTAYGNSKLANILTANEFARRYGDQGIIAHSLHPGAVKSNIYRNGNITGFRSMIVKSIYGLVGISLEKGAETTTLLATSEEALKSNGKYWNKSKIEKAKLPSQDVANQLWDLSVQLTNS